MTIQTIASPLPGERVLGLSPGNATEAATTWLRRPNLFPGRALTAASLQQRQQWQAGHLVQRASTWVAGIDSGLEVRLADDPGVPDMVGVIITVDRGLALSASGEDVVLQRPLHCRLGDIPVVAPPGFFVDGSGVGNSGPGGTLLPRSIGPTLSQLPPAARAALPAVGVLVLQPVQVDTANLDALDPCDRSAFDEGTAADPSVFEDWRIGDGVRLLWYVWPGEWRPLPLPEEPMQLRNAVAWTVFQAEAALARDDAMPWDAFGVPVALAAVHEFGPPQGLRPVWVDRASVARRGGRARDAHLRSVGSRLAADPRLPSLWQARIEQFAEQVAALDGADAGLLSVSFGAYLPPVGLLPRHCFDPVSQQSNFFPPQFDLDAAPVPVEQLDLAVRASAGLAPLDVAAQESVRLLVPVPLAHWEPRLLIREVVDAEFQRTVERHLLERARALGARQGLRNKAALLAHALDGQVHSVPSHKDDPTATEPESLSPWGEPPVGGGHRSALLAGLHQHLFYGAAPTFDVGAGESLFVWAYLDPDHPPRTLMLQWHALEPNGTVTWEHRAFWGEDSIALGSAAVPSGHRRIGDLPTPGAWVMLVVSAASVGLEGRRVDGMAFTLLDGRAAFGLAGARTSNTWRKWFCNVLPMAVGIQGNEPWDMLSQNDLWAPFEPRNGVVPSLPVPLGQGAAEPPVESPLRTPRSGFNVQYSAAAAWRGHSFELFDSSTGPGPLRLQLRGDQAIDGKLLCSVYLDELTPPRALFASLSLSVFGDEMGFSDHHVFWGEDHLAELAQAAPGMRVAPAQVLRAGALPQSSRWVQIEVPLPPEHESLAVYEIRLFAFGGVLAFSDITFGRPTPPVTQTGGWTLVAEPVWPRRQRDGTLHAPMTPLLGGKVWLRNNLGVLTPTPSALIGTAQVYTDLMKETALARLSGHEQSQLLLRGLSGFADYLRQRIDRADDITDFGFAHMQVDMHRVRQVVMSTSDAARLAVSPALAAIARSDSALVVQDQIAAYLGKVRAAAVQKTAAPAAPAAPAPVARAVARAVEAEPVFTATATARAAGIATRARLITAPRAPLDIVYAQPVIGLSEVRTTAIAERLRQPPSTEARDYALANRQRTVRSLLELLQAFMAEDGGSVPALLKDFEIPGLDGDPFLEGAVSRRRKLADFLANAGLLGKLLSPPPVAPGTTAADEASLFTQTVALSDNTIAVLRQLEGRLAVYREALARCDAAVAALLANIAATQQGLTSAEDSLAEARHDVSVARALLAEETQRIADINTRRSRVLAEEVKFLAYIRPRETDNLRPTPTHAVDPALVEAPVPACLREHPDLADPLLDMLSVVREAPANWFVKMPVLMQRLDRVEYLQRSLQTAQVRVAAGLAVPRSIVPPSASKLGQAAARVSARQVEALAPRMAALQALDLTVLTSATWKTVQVQAQQVLSFGDLADGTHGRSDVAQAAATELHGIRSIVACLHAEFCGIPPALRLAWAETLSEFDEAPSLRNLASLPRWSEIGSIDRRQMQAYVDWLFGQIEPNQPQAVALINDVVRMCLLLASHAPVDRIVSGRLARPVTGVSPGIRIPLKVLDAAPVRVGMQAVLYRGDAVVARAVVEDLGSLEVSAHVIHTATAKVDLGDDVRVHFDDAAMLSLKPASAKRTLFGR